MAFALQPAVGLAVPSYLSTYTYDANGNITAAERWDRDGNQYDDFSYKYEQRSGRLERNRLYQLNDLADAGNLYVNEANGAKDIGYTGNLPFVAEATTINEDYNYSYDQLGNLIKDDREGIANIQWTVAGKVKQVEKTDGTVLTFAYGADGQRLWKEVTPPVLDDTGYREYYIRDAQGNVMATYRSQLIVVPSPEPQGYAASLRVTERPVYGSSRLGTYARWEELYDHPVVSTPTPDPVQPVDLNYELTDHLGNVTAVVTGRLLNGNGGGTPKQAELVSAQGYEAFGSLLPGRNYSSDSYRFGFNGQLKDDEVYGATGTSYTAEFWQYDPRTARRWNLDPVVTPSLSSYHAFELNPIWKVDPLGNRADEYEVNGETGEKTKISDLGGDEVDYMHYKGGALDGTTQIVERATGSSNWMSSSRFVSGYTHRGKDDTGHEVDWFDIYSEFRTGTGPEKSLMYGSGLRMNRELALSPQFQEAYDAWRANGTDKKFQFEGSFGPLGAYEAGSNMTAQMVGKANFSFYPVGNTLVIMIVDSKSVTSWSLNPFAKGESNNVPRVDGVGGPESTTHQTYLWHIPLTSDPRKVAGKGGVGFSNMMRTLPKLLGN